VRSLGQSAAGSVKTAAVADIDEDHRMGFVVRIAARSPFATVLVSRARSKVLSRRPFSFLGTKGAGQAQEAWLNP